MVNANSITRKASASSPLSVAGVVDLRWFGRRDEQDPLLAAIERRFNASSAAEILWLHQQVDRIFHQYMRRWAREANE